MSQETYLHNLAMQDKYTKKPTVMEIAQAFPDCRALVASYIYILEEELEVYDENEWFNQIIRELDKRYIHLKELKKFMKYTQPNKKKSNLDIPQAKSVHIETLYDFQKIKRNHKRITISCCFHEDKTPSAIINLNDNTYHCFSCGKHLDSIAFVQEIYKLNFIDSVRMLNQRR